MACHFQIGCTPVISLKQPFHGMKCFVDVIYHFINCICTSHCSPRSAAWTGLPRSAPLCAAGVRSAPRMLWACHHSPGQSGTAHSSRPFRHRHSLRTSQAHSFRTPNRSPNSPLLYAIPCPLPRTLLMTKPKTLSQHIATLCALSKTTPFGQPNRSPYSPPLIAILCPPSRVLLTHAPLPLLTHHHHLLHIRLVMIGANARSTAQGWTATYVASKFLLCKNPNNGWPRHLFLDSHVFHVRSLLSHIRDTAIPHPGSYPTSGNSFSASGTVSSHPVTLSHIRSRR